MSAPLGRRVLDKIKAKALKPLQQLVQTLDDIRSRLENLHPSQQAARGILEMVRTFHMESLYTA
jgi:hypothetical protein